MREAGFSFQTKSRLFPVMNVADQMCSHSNGYYKKYIVRRKAMEVPQHRQSILSGILAYHQDCHQTNITLCSASNNFFFDFGIEDHHQVAALVNGIFETNPNSGSSVASVSDNNLSLPSHCSVTEHLLDDVRPLEKEVAYLRRSLSRPRNTWSAYSLI
ncbi:hypothetical protein NPIL_600171 [Nephila pilipes]|uniref:Uncharacterized protein n=1 Tax=Nephila pilipes TaxID=299642 RepID=A0A8X6Q5W5_NEPPI|nr:hypothetical protein NPIL_600171 [Nephila pilipes]